MAAFDRMSAELDELEEDQDMISLHQFGLLMIDWTNPAKVVEGWVF